MSAALYCLLEKSAAEFPRRPAVSFAGTSLCYSDLLAASGRFAVFLQKYGIAPGCRVAFSFQKSTEALIALFGIIRRGATYVPLDLSWPADRVATICQDADVRLWVGTKPPPTSVHVPAVTLNADGQDATPLHSAFNAPTPTTEPEEPEQDLANVLYTSGSTGRPKGVQITAESLLHFSSWAVDYFGITAADRLSNHAPFHFDLSTFDIFAAIRAGAAICPVPERTKILPYQTAKWIARERISVWYSVPSAWAMMSAKLAEHDLGRLQHVVFAGEVMPQAVLRSLAEAVPRAVLTNLYGPTETNVCTYYRVRPSDLQSDEPLPIGYPISSTRVWVVDEAGNTTTDTSRGELLVSGPTVTSGYLGDPQLTAARLVPAPDERGLAFRTGDAVARRGDGALCFHGRLDRMMKCRGYRIEPGEIEAVLCRHPAVREAAVVPVSAPDFGNRIKACVAVDSACRAPETELSAFCDAHLPAHMLPDIWSISESLPRTDRGKINFAALMQE